MDLDRNHCCSMIRGRVSSTVLTLIVIPVLHSLWRRVQFRATISSPGLAWYI
jgi:Cu/Ag efflux pump CusA